MINSFGQEPILAFQKSWVIALPEDAVLFGGNDSVAET